MESKWVSGYGVITRYFLLPTPYSLLPTPYSLLPTPYSLLPTPCFLQDAAYYDVITRYLRSLQMSVPTYELQVGSKK